MFNGRLYHCLLPIICLTLLMYTALANPVDTSGKKNDFGISHNGLYTTLSVANFQDAIRALRADSTEKALHMLAPFLRESERQSNVSRMSGFTELMLTHLILDADEGKLRANERQVLGSLLKAEITHDPQAFKEIKKTMGILSPGLFAAHIRLLVLSGLGDEKAAKEADKILREHPADMEVNLQKAEWLYDQDKFNESLLYCNQVISLFPQSAYAYDLRGKDYNMLGKPDDAIADFDAATRLYPANKLVLYHKAMALMDKKEYRRAISALLISRTADAGYIWTEYNLACCYRKLGIPDSAIFYADQHINNFPSDDDGYDLKGNIYYDKDEYKDAIAQYDRAIRISPQKETFYEDRGDAYFYDQKYDLALADFMQAIALDKQRAYSAKRAGDTYYEMGDYPRALQYQQASVAIDTAYNYGYVSLSLTKIALNDFQGAITDGQKAIAIDSTYDVALGNLGWAYYCAGDNDNCILYSYKALECDPGAAYAMFNIALATLKKGDAENAKTLYKQFIDECNAKGYAIDDSAIDQLKDLIKKNIAVDDCKFIIGQLFGKRLDK